METKIASLWKINNLLAPKKCLQPQHYNKNPSMDFTKITRKACVYTKYRYFLNSKPQIKFPMKIKSQKNNRPNLAKPSNLLGNSIVSITMKKYQFNWDIVDYELCSILLPHMGELHLFGKSICQVEFILYVLHI